MAPLQIHQFPCLSDNYGVLVHDPDADVTASIDTPEAAAVERALAATGWRLTHILNTHHHHDHTGGNLELKERTGCTIVGPRGEAAKVPGLDVAVGDGDSYRFGTREARIIETPGHTLGHIAYHFAGDRVAFVGDTLFALGCGRVFEGTPAQMWASLSKLMALPADTTIYCGHEYTQANARFAVTVDPANEALARRAAEIADLRARGEPTVPTTLAAELATNPFLRADDPDIRAHLGMADADPVEVFAEIRRRKDNF
jgi:hydroxyacylglutathione hydrolase